MGGDDHGGAARVVGELEVGDAVGLGDVVLEQCRNYSRDASLLARCEAQRIKLENCPAYIREWITREREGK